MVAEEENSLERVLRQERAKNYVSQQDRQITDRRFSAEITVKSQQSQQAQQASNKTTTQPPSSRW
jgi:hypothetical protein